MVRVYDLATTFRLTTKEVLERLRAGGIDALTFGSTVEEERAREILSQPMARIPAHAIRPGTAAPAKPAARRSTRSKATAAPGEGAETPGAAPKVRPRAKPATEGETKGEPKARTPRPQPPASLKAKPLVVTLDAPSVEPAVRVAPSAVATPPDATPSEPALEAHVSPAVPAMLAAETAPAPAEPPKPAAASAPT